MNIFIKFFNTSLHSLHKRYQFFEYASENTKNEHKDRDSKLS